MDLNIAFCITLKQKGSEHVTSPPVHHAKRYMSCDGQQLFGGLTANLFLAENESIMRSTCGIRK